MVGHGWPLAAVLLVSVPSVCLAQQDSRGNTTATAERSLLEDAELADVFFIDAQRGWAVGDRGVIWHTDDGGRHWRPQASSVDCRLESVHFVDRERGWVAGRLTAPYTHNSRGVLLRTENGGRTWSRDKAVVLPALRRVKFFSAAHGWVLGDTSAVFASGVFVTDDGGRTWTPMASDAGSGWLAGDFLDPHCGAVAGRRAALAAIRQRTLRPSRVTSLGLRTVRQLRLSGPTSAWMVGDGGLVMNSADLGASWNPPAGELPAVVEDSFDFAALAVLGNQCWIAGTPGTRVLHTADAGRTWRLFPTGQHLPIEALHFSDADNGWAVGALGHILHSADGGRTWHRQRTGGERAAVYGIYADPAAVPLEMFAQLSGNDGYLGRVHIIARGDLDAPRASAATLPERTHAALVGVGASGAETSWRFPLRDAGLALPVQHLVAGFDAANAGAGLDRLEKELVRNIRVWRPSVVFTHGARPRGDDALGHLMNQVVVRAVERAADPAWSESLASEAGLKAWQVKKVYTARPPGEKGDESLTTSQLAPRLGRSLAEAASSPRGQLSGEFLAAPTLLGFQLAVNRLPRGIGTRGFFSGIRLPAGSAARRELSALADRDLDNLRKMARRHRDLQAILSHASHQSGGRLLAQVGDMTTQLPAENAGSVLFHLGQQFHHSGQWLMAAEVFELLARKYPDHPLTAPALVWLVQFWSSGEAAWRIDGRQRVTVRQAAAGPAAKRSLPPLGQVLPGNEPSPFGPGGRTGQRSALAIDPRTKADRTAKAAEVIRLFKQLHPTLYEEPTVRFPLAAASRRQGLTNEADAYYRAVRSIRPEDAWWACAAGERWLTEGGGAPPKSALYCEMVTQKPRLDGRLHDAAWRNVRPIELRSRLRDDAAWPAAVRLAYDNEFLYLAVECQRAPAAQYEQTDATRPRDADLSRRDRVELFIDLDRDWATAWKLTVDHRGWTADSCWGDASWDPTWFVASDRDAQSWTVEAAVALDQLTGAYPESKTVWALGVQRIVPGVGFQSWTQPAATEVMPEGFGYLLFD